MVPPAIAEQLRRRGFDAAAVADLDDLRGRPDVEVLERATSEARVVVTYDRDDFLDIGHAWREQGIHHSGIVILNRRRFPQGPDSIGALVRSLEAFATMSMEGSFVHWLA